MRLLSNRSVFLLAAFAVLLIAGAPHAARAQAQQAQTFDPAQCTQTVQNNLMKAAQERTAAEQAVDASVPYLDSSMYCLNSLMQDFQTIGSIADPMGIVQSLIGQLVNSLLTQVCQAAQSVISQATSYVSSLGNALCVPMPSMPSLNLNANLGLKNPTCNGVSLLSLSVVSGTSALPPRAYTIWNTQPGQGQ